MSRNDSHDDPIQDYLAECHEHLSHIESDLLAMEAAGAEADEELVNRVFRAAHSIKGGAGFFGLTAIRELAHRIENVLDLMRSRQMTPTPEAVSVLLLSFDKLRDLLSRPQDDDRASVEEYSAQLARLAAGNLPGAEANAVTERIALAVPGRAAPVEASAFDWAQARKTGKCVYVVRYDLIHDVHRLGRTPYQALKRLIEYGTVLETIFNIESAGTLDEDPPNTLLLDVVYASALDTDLICSALDLPPDRTYRFDRDGTLKGSVGELERRTAAEERPAGSAAAPNPHEPPVAPRAPDKAPPAADPTVRLNVTLLDSLMTLAGELVLGRNQLTEAVGRSDERAVRSSAQRIGQVTSELQEAITQTRMQPVGGLFARFPRLVRDLGRDLGKEVRLEVEGAEVELDKTLIEGLGDPLTHMVRNAVDHGIEAPQVRRARGKPPSGVITLRAAQQAGQVVLEVSDDGEGLDGEKIAATALDKGLITREQSASMTDQDRAALILLPGLSTATQVSDVSGRGVGMDVVKTNVDRLGGKMEINSAVGRGTTFRIKLPLTLAIIPSLLVSDRGEQFAIPQVRVAELIRIRAGQWAQRIGCVGSAETLSVRGRLVPLVHLSESLGLQRDDSPDRAWNVVLVDAGTFEYGLVVDRLHETVEIVVKPLGHHLKGLAEYAGATILGDGRVAVILDVAGLAVRAGLSSSGHSSALPAEAGFAEEEKVSLLLFDNAPGERCAVPIHMVSRIERVQPNQIEYLGGKRTMQYRGATLPVLALADVASLGAVEESQSWVVIVFELGREATGLLTAEPLDIAEAALTLDRRTLRQPGIAGSVILKQRTTLMVELSELAGVAARPEEAEIAAPAAPGALPARDGKKPTVLLAEDSDFFRTQLRRLIESVGCNVLAAEDGQAAWELLEQHAGEVELVTTDIEMPRMDGLALTRRIRTDARFEGLPVIAVSTLAGEEEIARGMAAGVTEYQIKLNQDDLARSIRKAMRDETRAPGSRS